MFGERQFIGWEKQEEYQYKGNAVHPLAFVGKDVKMGSGNYIGPFCYITGDTTIGDRNRFESHCCIGTQPEHRDFWEGGNKTKGVLIDNGCLFREFVTVQAGTIRHTSIESGCILLTASYVAHDCFLEQGVTLSAKAMVGGKSYLFGGVNMGLGAKCHQYSVLGHYAMIGMGAIITKKIEVLPCRTYVGNPARELGWNNHAIKLHHILPVTIEKFMYAWHQQRVKAQE